MIGVAAKGFTGTGIPGPELWTATRRADTRSARDDARRTHVHIDVVGALTPAPRSRPPRRRSPPSRDGSSRRIRTSTPATHFEMCHAVTPAVHARSGQRRDDHDARRAPDDHAGDRPPRRLPQSRRSAAGARPRAPAGTGDQVVTRRRPMAPHAATAHRRTAAGVCRRRRRAGALDMGDWRAARVVRPVIPVGVNLPELDLDWRVLVGTVGFCMAASLVFGAWPAWTLTGRAVVTDLKRQTGEEGRRREAQHRQCAGHRPGRALGAPPRDRRTVPDERDLGRDRRPGLLPRRRRGRGDRSRSRRLRREHEGDRRISRWSIGCEHVPGVEAVDASVRACRSRRRR